jgi:hypothetical protein
MLNDNKTFTEEAEGYESDSGTELPDMDTTETIKDQDMKNETEATLPKYGESKPRRHIIKGKVFP